MTTLLEALVFGLLLTDLLRITAGPERGCIFHRRDCTPFTGVAVPLSKKEVLGYLEGRIAALMSDDAADIRRTVKWLLNPTYTSTLTAVGIIMLLLSRRSYEIQAAQGDDKGAGGEGGQTCHYSYDYTPGR